MMNMLNSLYDIDAVCLYLFSSPEHIVLKGSF